MRNTDSSFLFCIVKKFMINFHLYIFLTVTLFVCSCFLNEL